MTIEEYTKIDTTFNRSLFIGEMNQMIQDIYMAITENQVERIKKYVKEEVYQKIQAILERNTQDGSSLKFKYVSIDSVIRSFELENNIPVIKITSTCTFAKYYVKEGEVVRGNETKQIQVIHNFKVQKRKEALSFYRCQGCGASYDITTDKICPHCGKSLLGETHNYLIVEME
ncbi:MAG: TIM44-like domain-containing protein [Bacilli bacterium]|nr:TIM44-like domain-containing protein [Bacilli bacterium]